MAETQCRVAICPVIPVTDGAVEHCVILFLCAVKLIEFDAEHCGLRPAQAALEATEATAAAVTVTVVEAGVVATAQAEVMTEMGAAKRTALKKTAAAAEAARTQDRTLLPAAAQSRTEVA